MPRSISLFAIPLLVVLSTAAHAQCPQSTVTIQGRNASGPFDITNVSEAPTAQVSTGIGTKASYDRVARNIRAVADLYVIEGYEYIARATVVERFQLAGASAAWVTVRLVLTESIGTDSAGRTAWEASSAMLKVGDQVLNTVAGNNQYVAPFLELSTNVTNGEPLEVTYEVKAESYGNEPYVNLAGHLEFVGLPEGLLVPCQELLAVEPTTWGAVKSMYR